ncbi:MAG: outer membrane beta-barrel protein [Proteobacteria bacterium]|nr:outer membrane beta-barrel protein [Pseudomonadota bacterium]
MKKFQTTLALTALAAALAAPAAFAQSATDSDSAGQGFVRGELGKTKLKDTSSSDNVKDTSYNIRGGYMFNRNIGVEGFYGRYYDKNSHNLGFDQNTKLDGYGAGVVGKVRFGEQTADTGFYGSGRVGLMHANYKASATNTTGGITTNYSVSSNSNQPYYGVGVGYDFNRNMGVGLNYDYFHGRVRVPTTGSKVSYNAQTLGADFEYRF